MIKIKFVPSYVFDPRYNMHFVHAMRLYDGTLEYQQCFTTKAAATRKFNTLRKRYGEEFEGKFIMCSISEIER